MCPLQHVAARVSRTCNTFFLSVFLFFFFFLIDCMKDPFIRLQDTLARLICHPVQKAFLSLLTLLPYSILLRFLKTCYLAKSNTWLLLPWLLDASFGSCCRERVKRSPFIKHIHFQTSQRVKPKCELRYRFYYGGRRTLPCSNGSILCKRKS